MKRPPPVIRKDLIGLRRTLAGAEKRYEKAERELRELKKRSGGFASMDAEMRLHQIHSEIERTRRAIKSAEEELAGDWRPMGWDWREVEMSKIGLLLCCAILSMIFAIAYASRAECAFCPSYTCYSSSMCGNGCICLKRGMDQGGECYSAD